MSHLELIHGVPVTPEGVHEEEIVIVRGSQRAAMARLKHALGGGVVLIISSYAYLHVGLFWVMHSVGKKDLLRRQVYEGMSGMKPEHLLLASRKAPSCCISLLITCWSTVSLSSWTDAFSSPIDCHQ